MLTIGLLYIQPKFWHGMHAVDKWNVAAGTQIVMIYLCEVGVRVLISRLS